MKKPSRCPRATLGNGAVLVPAWPDLGGVYTDGFGDDFFALWPVPLQRICEGGWRGVTVVFCQSPKAPSALV